MDIMTSWAMVAEVHYLEPQTIRKGESDIEFSSRVKKMIADAAGLKNVQWNGYLKHYKPSERVINAQKKLMADRLETLYQHTWGHHAQSMRHSAKMSVSALSQIGAMGNGTSHSIMESSGMRNRFSSEKIAGGNTK